MNQEELIEVIKKAADDNATSLNLRLKLLLTYPRTILLPPEIGQLTNLRTLDLRYNDLKALPPEIGQLTNLQHLDLYGNQLESLPPEIGQLINLQQLDLSKNQVTSLPQEIVKLTNLRSLYLMGNQFTLLPQEIVKLTNLQDLELRINKLTSLPPEIGRLISLLKLDLRDNLLKTLPAEIGLLTNLQSLSLNRNELTWLPPEVGQLTNLLTLGLNENKLTELPPQIGQLISLQLLELGDNLLKTLPTEIGLLTNLQTLFLNRNQLETLPPQISQLTNLQKLFVSQNQLTELPPQIGQLTNLRMLIPNANQLKTLPPEIGLLTNLQILSLQGNQLISPPPEIVEQGSKAILAYLQARLQDSRKQWVSKLLVVGEGGAGKTSIMRSLRGEPFDPQESTTHGIDIRSLSVNHPTETDVTMQLNTWDFGGQEIYHATHQFFLTNRSLFLLVWNARLGFEQGKLYYWLDTIKARAPESPVLIVAAFIDERDANVPLADLRRKYPQIVGHCEISNKTGEGIEGLRTAIADAAANLPLMGEIWPTNWLNAANAIRSKAKAKNHITPNQLRAIMAERDVAHDKAGILAQWLHELGDILYFKDDQELNDTVILNPQWVTQSISKVLESQEVINNQGLFMRDHMNELWSDVDPAMRDHFLRLMEKFDLSYRTLENKDISLVVERLNLDPPDYEKTWNAIKESGTCNEISMKFVLDTTMPAGIPTWFIARSHRFTTYTHWRYGGLFADGPERKHLGLLQAFPHDRYLQLTVRGTTPHNFFALLSDGLEVTLKRFPGMAIDRKIPCPGHNDKACSHEFDLAHLQRAIERKPPILEIQCPVAFENVSVPGLLVGLPWSMTNEVIAKQYKEVRLEMKYLRGGVDELRELTQREFTKLFHREQAKIESYCPNIFVLRPVKPANWLKNILGQKMELQLYCQAPGQWHPAEVGGLYKVNQSAEWLQTMAPYIRRMLSALKYATPLVGPWVGVLSPDHYKKLFENDIKFMEALVNKLPDIKEIESETFDDLRLSVAFVDSETERAEGAALRILRSLLDEKDPQQQWGGLKRIVTPEGHYLWLCQSHAAEYAR